MNNIIGDMTADGALSSSFSSITDSIVIADITERLVYRGLGWSSRRVISIPSGISNLYFNPTAAIGQNKLIVLYPPIFTAISASEIIVTEYVGSTYTGGTNQISFNRNQNYGGSPLSVINYNGTLGNVGVEGAQFLIPASGAGPIQTTGVSTSTIILIINENLITRVQLNNTAVGSSDLEYSLIWAEIDL